MSDFGWALGALRAGDAVRRGSWNFDALSGRDSLILVPGSPELVVEASRPLGQALPHLVGEELHYGAHIDMVHTSGIGVWVSPWQPTQEDLLACDWGYAR